MLQFAQILVMEILAIYFLIYLMLELDKEIKRKRYKVLQVSEEEYERWVKLKEQLDGVTNSDMMGYALDVMIKDITKRKLTPQKTLKEDNKP